MSKEMTREEERKYYEKNKERNLRYIRAKLPSASPRELGLIAGFVSGLRIMGFSESEYNRDIKYEDKDLI